MAGIENSGFVIKNFDELKTELEENFKQVLGENINLDSTSILGNMVAIQAKQLSDVWQLGSSVYNSRHINSANGQSIDRIVELLNIAREQERRTAGVAYIYGTFGIVIPVGTNFSSQNGAIYETIEQATIASGSFPILNFNRNSGVTLNTFNISALNNLYGLFESPSGNTFFTINYNDDISTLTSAFRNFFGADSINSVRRETNNSITVNFAVKMFLPFFQSAGMTITVNRPGLLDGVAVRVQNIVPGDIVTNRGELNVIESPINGMDGVINFSDFERGRLQETDSQLRQKWFARIGSPVSASPASIKRELLKLNGVLQAIIFESSSGPGTVEIVINGGDSTEIAQTLLDNKVIGIEYVGNISEDALDEDGSNVPILFSRPTLINFEVRVDISRLPNFPIDGVEQIKDLLNDYEDRFVIGSVLRPTPDMIWSLQEVQGLNSLSITLQKEGNALFSSDSVVLTNREKPNFTRIRVYENGVEI